jgi:hypothetical protein
MPGCGGVNGYERLSIYAKESIERHWPQAKRGPAKRGPKKGTKKGTDLFPSGKVDENRREDRDLAHLLSARHNRCPS